GTPRRGIKPARPSAGSPPRTAPSTRRCCPGEGHRRAAHLLRVPRRTLEAPAHVERDRVAVRGGAPAYGRGEAVQEGRERDGVDLADTDGGGAAIPATRCAGATQRGLRREEICRRKTREGEDAEGRRLIRRPHPAWSEYGPYERLGGHDVGPRFTRREGLGAQPPVLRRGAASARSCPDRGLRGPRVGLRCHGRSVWR